MIVRSILLAMFGVLLFSGCTTEFKRAEKFYEAGAYDEAIASYEKALQYNPKNDDAKLGLIKARGKWIESKLLEVRMLRTSGNTGESLELLAKIYLKETEWGQMPKAPASFTQEEETQLAARSAAEEIRKRLKSGLTLGALHTSQKYGAFFQGGREKELASLKALVKTQGQTDCGKMTAQMKPTDYYYGQFASKYCQYFGSRTPDLKAQAAREIKSLYRGIRLVYSAQTDLPQETRTRIEELLQKEFQSTAWFDPAGKNVLELQASGNFIAKYEVQTKQLIHSYEVSIPYQETRIVPKPAQGQTSDNTISKISTGLNITSDVINIATGNTNSSGERDNGDGTMTITETKYRKEPRTFPYSADEHQQYFETNFSARGSLGGEDIILSLQKSDRHTSVSHNNNVASVGLYAKKASLWNEQEWLRDQIKDASFALKTKAQAAWSHRYCSSSFSENASITANDRIFRCLRVVNSEAPNENVGTWFGNTLGVTPFQAVQLLGDF